MGAAKPDHSSLSMRRQCPTFLLVAVLVACADETDDDERARETEADEYCEVYLGGGCSPDEAYAECRACYIACGEPCRANAACGNTEFACE